MLCVVGHLLMAAAPGRCLQQSLLQASLVVGQPPCPKHRAPAAGGRIGGSGRGEEQRYRHALAPGHFEIRADVLLVSRDPAIPRQRIPVQLNLQLGTADGTQEVLFPELLRQLQTEAVMGQQAVEAGGGALGGVLF